MRRRGGGRLLSGSGQLWAEVQRSQPAMGYPAMSEHIATTSATTAEVLYTEKAEARRHESEVEGGPSISD